MNVDQVDFRWASDAICADPLRYWERVIDIASNNSLARITKCCQIMGRKEGESLHASQIMYPCMQCADVFFLGVDICQLGIDQRKVNMLAREYASLRRLTPPVILSHGMIMSLKGPEDKMSKSSPEGAIFCDDPPEVVEQKVRKAYCVAKEIYGPDGKTMINPIMQYVERIILPYSGEIEIDGKKYCDFREIARLYTEGQIRTAEPEEGADRSGEPRAASRFARISPAARTLSCWLKSWRSKSSGE